MVLTACSHGGNAPSTTVTSVSFTGDAGSSFCTLLRGLDTQDVLKNQDGTPTSVEAGFTKLRQVLVNTAAQAPPELSKDVSLLAAGISALDDALRAVGYDYKALAASPNALTVSAAINDPTFGVAGTRISAYKAQVCHL